LNYIGSIFIDGFYFCFRRNHLKETAEILQRLIDGEIDVKELAKEIDAKRKGHKDDVAYL
jgi:hypothetical protein